MDILRTPDERFADLPDFPFAPHYVEVDGLRMHYLDEGPADGPVVLLLHGEPSWSYLYRRMIPVLVDAGLRAVAIDLVGFGRSDKPTRREDYTYQAHVDWTWAAIEAIGLTGITLVCQDWGGLIGLRLVGEHPDRFARVVAANTTLPTGDQRPGEAFLAWQRFSQETPDFAVGHIVNGGCVSTLAPEVIAAYDAPFPDDSYKAGARQFPTLVPTSPDDPAAPANRAAWEVLRTFDRPFLCAYCGAGRGAISENVLDVVFVARNETTSKYQVVGFYEEAEVLPESDDEWKTVKSKSVWLYPPQKRPEIDWPAGQATRRWARRVNGNGKQHDALYKLFINLGKPDGTSRNIDTDPELSAFEGTKKERFILHRTRESKLRSAKIRSALEKGSGRLCCQVPRCGFDFYDKYGEIGHKFAIVHHLSPLGLAHEDGVNTTLDELAIVCANCHAMIHRGGECRELSTLIPE